MVYFHEVLWKAEHKGLITSFWRMQSIEGIFERIFLTSITARKGTPAPRLTTTPIHLPRWRPQGRSSSRGRSTRRTRWVGVLVSVGVGVLCVYVKRIIVKMY